MSLNKDGKGEKQNITLIQMCDISSETVILTLKLKILWIIITTNYWRIEMTFVLRAQQQIEF